MQVSEQLSGWHGKAKDRATQFGFPPGMEPRGLNRSLSLARIPIGRRKATLDPLLESTVARPTWRGKEHRRTRSGTRTTWALGRPNRLSPAVAGPHTRKPRPP